MFYSFRETSPENPSNQTLLFMCVSGCVRLNGGGRDVCTGARKKLPWTGLIYSSCLVCMRKLTNWREWIVAEKKTERHSKACSAQAQICEYLFWRGNLIFFPTSLSHSMWMSSSSSCLVGLQMKSRQKCSDAFRWFQGVTVALSISLHALISKGFPSILVRRAPSENVRRPPEKRTKNLEKSVFPHLKCPLHTLRTCALLFRGVLFVPSLCHLHTRNEANNQQTKRMM